MTWEARLAGAVRYVLEADGGTSAREMEDG